MKNLILLVVLKSFCIISFAQDDNCKVMLKQSIQKMKTSTGKGFHMVYEVDTEFKTDDGNKRHNTRAEVIVNNEKSVFRSDAMDIYKDEKYMVTINKDEKVIYLSNAVTSDWKKMQAETFSILHDTLLTKVQVTSCETSCPQKEDAKFVDKVSVSLPEAYIGALGIESMIYWIDSESKQVVRCVISYRNHRMGVKTVDFVIKEYVYDYRERAYEGDAISRVISKNNKLVNLYKDYTLKDIR